VLRPTVRRARAGVPEQERVAKSAARGSEREDKTAARQPQGTPVSPAGREAAVPEEVRKRFVQVGRKYYFPDGARAFTDRGSRLTTPSENTEVIRSLVTIAQTRGWGDVTVSGTERFRREAWFAAKQAGLAVRGYRPTEFEQERLARTVARDSGQDRTRESRERETRIAEPGRPDARRRDGILWGRLVDHGRAAFHHDPHEAMSYFVKLETERGERTVWGVDLERAVKESLTRPQLGDEVGLRAVRKDVVTVKAPRRDADGHVIGEQDLQTHRNRWAVEKREFFDARSAAADTVRNPAIAARQAMQTHPELAGTYLYLRGAEEIARRRIRDPEDQRRFVEVIRGALADSVGRGEPLPTVRLHERSHSSRNERPARANDREPAAVRS
jgi:putative DNA primase/helicase